MWVYFGSIKNPNITFASYCNPYMMIIVTSNCKSVMNHRFYLLL